MFAGSVQQNILFGKEFDPDWYERVITECALKRDMELFPFGDKTLVGDRGSSLSGGQKARITLARAVYSNADVYLLDDPLSAVDAEVGRHLFEKCITGILSDKAVILVTHQLQFLKSVGQILLLDEGKVQAQGSYSDLLSSGIDFAQLMSPEDENEEDGTGTPNISPLKRASIISIARQRTLSEASIASALSRGSYQRKGSLTLMTTGEGSLTGISSTIQYNFCKTKTKTKRHLKTIPGNTYIMENNDDSDGDDAVSLTTGGSPTKVRMLKGDDDEKKDSGAPKATEETTKSGGVKWSLYWKYFSAGASFFVLFLLVLFCILAQVLFSGADWWLNFW